MKHRFATDIIMHDQQLWYGGEQKTRQQIMDDLLAAGFTKVDADRYLFYLGEHQSKNEGNMIKCRIWDKERKQMLYSVEPQEHGKREYYPIVFNIGFSVWRKEDFSEPMLFTGSFSKDGEGIYEGDIISTDNEPIGDYPVEKHYRGVVTRSEKGYFYIKQSGQSYAPQISNYNIMGIEIIGNIYEHPECVEKKEA